MISLLIGKVHEILESSAIINCNGVGYEVFCTIGDLAKLSQKKSQNIEINTHLIHKEDSMNLYGFTDLKTKNGFLSLIKVSGIGPKAALKILSYFDVDDLFVGVENEDINLLKTIPGIGPKMAKKIIFELKGKLPHEIDENLSTIEKDLISALVNLGYNGNDVRDKLYKLKPVSDNFEKEFKRLLKELSA